MVGVSEPLRLPEGYGIEMHRGDPDLLVLKRSDGSAVAAFEISAFGPEPDQIMRMAVDDAEYREQLKQNDSSDDNRCR